MKNIKINLIQITIFILIGLCIGYFMGDRNILDIISIKKVFGADKNTEVKFENRDLTDIKDLDLSKLDILNEVRGDMSKKFVSWKATYTPPTAKEVEQSIVSGYVNSFKDPYTIYFPPVSAKAFEENVKGSFGGVGMEVGEKDGYITVIAPLKDSPSQKAGIKAGDVVLFVGGQDISNMSTEQAVSFIRGEAGTVVKIKIFRPAEKIQKEFEIKREIIKIPTLDTELKNGVFIIHLYNFSAESPELFRNALVKFTESNVDKMIIDLRGNPGGYLEAAVNIASFFLDEGKMVVSEKGNESYGSIEHRAKAFKAFNEKLKLYVIVDGGSASASEILAGALQDQGVAKVYGQKSYGKGSVQEFINLKTAGALKVTVANWYTPNGKSITENKIVPDVELTRTSTTTAESEMNDILKMILKSK
jgi:carboxyl-terminal processing protease